MGGVLGVREGKRGGKEGSEGCPPDSRWKSSSPREFRGAKENGWDAVFRGVGVGEEEGRTRLLNSMRERDVEWNGLCHWSQEVSTEK